MSENSFDIEGIEPATVNFIDEQEGSTEEQPTGSTPGQESAAGAAEQPGQVQATPTESDENYRNLQAAFTRVTQDNSEMRNRLADLEARLAAPPAPTHQNSFQQPAPQAAEPDELDKKVADYEELKPFAARIKQLEAQVATQNTAVQKSNEDIQAAQDNSRREAHKQQIVATHPDAFVISATPDFQGWVARQPSYIQVAIARGSAAEVVDVITSYKAAGTRREQSPVDAARQIANPNVGTAVIKTPNSNKPTFTGAEIAAMSYAEFTRREPEILLAQQEGRVLP